MIFNRAAEQALGYAAKDVIGRRAIPIFMDPAELEARAAAKKKNRALPGRRSPP